VVGVGGPAVGDIRSRCLRLSDQSTAEALAVRNLLGHRLPLEPLQAKSEWYLILTSLSIMDSYYYLLLAFEGCCFGLVAFWLNNVVKCFISWTSII
jgi:hypothetical protein